MMLSPQGADFIARFEGFRPHRYRDAAGHWTIGYGHKLLPDESFTTVSESTALDWLAVDAAREMRPVERTLKIELAQYEYDALASLAYNIGGGAVSKSTLLKWLNSGNRSAAASEFMSWTKAGGVVLKGLIRRRQAEKRLFEMGEYE